MADNAVKTIRLRGIQENVSDTISTSNIQLNQISALSKGRVRLAADRGDAGLVDLPGIQHDDIACIEYSNGFKFWVRIDDYYLENQARQSRGTVNELDIWEIEPYFSDDSERGAAGLIVEAIEVFGVDLKGMAAEKLCAWFETKQLQKAGAGLYQWHTLSGPLKLNMLTAAIPAEDKSILLFIHGTGSSSAGGFGKLWEDSGKGLEARKALQARYGDSCYAYEHKSLTVSPIENALEIVNNLPDKADLHIVSHSRGGLVGELLCLGQRDKTDDALSPSNALLDNLFNPEQETTQGELLNHNLGIRKPEEYSVQKGQLRALVKMLDEKQIKVSRFVRVACPARGTSLASGRLDRWLSVLNFLSGSNDFIELLLGIVKMRTDPRTLPGLEAMMPGSALTRLLNHPKLKVTSDLTVIAGDIEGDNFWRKLKGQVLDWFYDSDHDLVVNTGSMYGGLRRLVGSARFFFDQGPNVNHFNYFKNGITVDKLAAGLLRNDYDQSGFIGIEKAQHAEPARRSQARAALTSGPLAIVLHGTMGSHLTQDNEHIWLDYSALAWGKLAELGITMPNVKATSLIDDYYGDFVNFIGASHQVETFAYDWRLSVIESSEHLARLVSSRLPGCEARQFPLRFVAHSMGGLVVRAMFARHPDLWKRFQNLPGSRFLMLGTPNAGSYEAVRWLTGWNPTLGKLSWLDAPHDMAGIVNIVNRYPGLLELLPRDDGNHNYTNLDFWKKLCLGADNNWPLPQSADLSKLSNVWQLVQNSPIDSARMFYIAGWAPETVCSFENIAGRGLFSTERPPMRFYADKKGDGTVPWAFGRLPGIKTWYVEDAVHDQLLAYSPAFPAYLDILQTGGTTRLPQQEPGKSRSVNANEDRRIVRYVMPDSLPSEQDLSGFVFGNVLPAKAGKKRRLPNVKVSIRHGNLSYACHPICVGHYYGDTIVSAERDLDKRLNGALSKRVSLGLYPGELNSHDIILQHDPYAKPNGAIIIGLGRVGQLSPGLLMSGIYQAVLDYALKISEWPDDRFGPANTARSAKLSFLLIGTGFGGISLSDSIQAILNAVKSVNNRLLETRFDEKVLFDEIEFLELWQDVAIRAARELEKILQTSQFQEHFNWWPDDHTIQPGKGGLQSVLYEPDASWWHRLEIVYDNKHQILRFIALTDRARAEVTLVASQMLLADQFIADMINDTQNARQLSQTLFEMLIPNRLKELAPNQYDVVLILDEQSARYPWELLDDRWSKIQKPQALVSGMLRQLKTQKFRNKPLQTTEKSAFIVGNPKIVTKEEDQIRFPDLPGAAKEAETVANLLSAHGYIINKSLKQQATELTAREILSGLYGEAYRILHLAGHGVHEFELENYSTDSNCQECGQNLPLTTKRISGMVIGNNTFLTPGDVEQMRWIPELVFINCCHLGKTGVSFPTSTRYNELAANLGTQFINMGVKAVIAAGWAVDDGAAKAFAEKFYQSLLTGNTFGAAVRIARNHVYEQFPDVNTWGAYQCYGDPDFRLLENGNKKSPAIIVYHCEAEWLGDLNNILRSLKSHHNETESYLSWLDHTFNRIPSDQLKEEWQKHADVAAVLGMIFGELGQYELAIHHLDQAVTAEKSELPVKAIEQRANYRVKLALQLHNTLNENDKNKSDEAIEQVDKAIAELNGLNQFAETKERLSLLGSAYKRLAWFQNDTSKRKAALEKMRENYYKAFDENAPDSYQLTNWGTAVAVASWFGGNVDQVTKNKIQHWASIVISNAQDRFKTSPDYWNSVVEPDCVSMLSLLEGEYKKQTIEHIAASYRRAAERGASPKDLSSVCEHLAFLQAMALAAKKTKIYKCLIEISRQLQ